nr:7094_t:CDS:2 [Entrophospora candida]CAG8604166.1 262_t:CDS:2 [Entrophospora candida]
MVDNKGENSELGQDKKRQQNKRLQKNYSEPILRSMLNLSNVNSESENGIITLMTYNLLAQSLCKRKLFPDSGEALKWKHRHPRLIQEILYYSPDIGCFQEMDELNYNDTFKDKFEHVGYETLFSKGYKKGNVKSVVIEYDKHGIPTMPTNCIGILIGTTHLYWRPESMYERARQALILIENILKFKEEVGFPAFLAGEDPIYQLIVKRLLSKEKITQLETSMRAFGEDENQKIGETNKDQATKSTPNTSLMTTPTLLSTFSKLPRCISIYGEYYKYVDPENVKHSEPKYTSYGLYFKGTLDYIFYILDNDNDDNRIKFTKLLKMPKEEEIGTSIPNFKFNSDHFCMMVEINGLM